MRNIYPYIKVVIGLLGSLLGLQHALRELAITAQEKSPTRISVDHWEQYHGQRWLMVDGQLAVERAVIHDARDEVNRAKGNVYAYVPIVPSGEAGKNPVHAVAVIGPLPGPDALRILSTRAGPATISGEIAPDGVYDHARVMPGEHLDPQAVFVNENTQPKSGAVMWILFVVALGMFIFCALILLRAIWGWMRSGRAVAKQVDG
jgi:hypothetical protein